MALRSVICPVCGVRRDGRCRPCPGPVVVIAGKPDMAYLAEEVADPSRLLGGVE